MTRVKICGIKTLEEALTVKSFGAWAIGEVFAPSTRRISREQAASINHSLSSGITVVGVFVDEPFDSILLAIRECSLDMVQLHGLEPPEYVQELPVPAIKAFSVTGPVDPEEVKRWRPWAYLFDSKALEFRGGSGHAFDWNLLSGVRDFKNLILAGGLNAGNITEAIREVHPFAVDISSGVEYPEGGKDPEKIKSLIEMVDFVGTTIDRPSSLS